MATLMTVVAKVKVVHLPLAGRASMQLHAPLQTKLFCYTG